MRFVFLKSLLLLTMVSSCGGVQIPAQNSPRSGPNVESSSSGNVTRVQGNQANRGNDAAFVAASAVTVGKGDTVYALSRRHRVPVSAIIRTNKLKPPYILQVGQRIQFPRGQQHRVQQGDTLYNIAQRYDVGLYELARLNDSEPPYTIKVGSILSIPNGNATSQPVTAAASPTTVPRKPAVSSIPSASPPPQRAPQSSSVPQSTPAPRPTPKPVAIPKQVPVGDKVAALPPKKPSVPGSRVSAPPPKSGKGFVWPLKGRVVSNFGAKDGGLRNDGINIRAPRGTPVRAAENGVVAYAGNEIRGFGNLLLIKHSGGYVTAYAHNDALLVRRGQKVQRGQKISTVGATGTVANPQLHFEIRKGRRPQDPRTYLSRTS